MIPDKQLARGIISSQLLIGYQKSVGGVGGETPRKTGGLGDIYMHKYTHIYYVLRIYTHKYISHELICEIKNALRVIGYLSSANAAIYNHYFLPLEMGAMNARGATAAKISPKLNKRRITFFFTL